MIIRNRDIRGRYGYKVSLLERGHQSTLRRFGGVREMEEMLTKRI